MKRKWYNIHCNCNNSWGAFSWGDLLCGVRDEACPFCEMFLWISRSENEVMSALQDMNE